MATADFAYRIVALVVIIIVITTVAIPVCNDMADGQYSTLNNDSELYKMQKFTSVEIAVTDSGITVNSVPFTPSNNIVAVSDNLIVNWLTDELVFYDALGPSGGITSGHKMTISGATYTVDSDPAVSGTIVGDFYAMSNNGTHGVFDVGEGFNLNLNSVMYASFIAFDFTDPDSNTAAVAGVIKGTANGFTYSGYDFTDSTAYDSTHFAVASVPVLSQIDDKAYEISGLTVAIALTDSDGVVWVTPITTITSLVAPLSYEGISSDDSSIRHLIEIIPLMLVIVALMFAVALIRARN